jgi:hypothetical protein
MMAKRSACFAPTKTRRLGILSVASKTYTWLQFSRNRQIAWSPLHDGGSTGYKSRNPIAVHALQAANKTKVFLRRLWIREISRTGTSSKFDPCHDNDMYMNIISLGAA